MRKVAVSIMVLAIMVMVYGCGSSSSTTTTSTTPTLSTIDTLPGATDPVVDAASGSIVTKALPIKATTGMPLGTITGDDMSNESSMAACEYFNSVKEAISSAAQADLILCYIQQIATSDSMVNSGIDIYDGDYHVFDLSITGSEEEGMTPDHIKMKLVKTGDTITSFEMFSCNSGSQTEYISQTIDGTTVAITGKGTYTSGSNTGWHQVSATGTLNTTGNYTAKDITIANSNTDSNDDTHYGSFTLAQTATQFTGSGYGAGSWTAGEDLGTYQQQSYCISELIDSNTSAGSDYDIGLLSVGDGACQVTSVNTQGEENFTWSTTEGFSGDTPYGADATMATTYDPSAGTLPDVSEVTIAFTDAQTYDCGDTAEASVTGDETVMNAACSTLNLSHEWINCWNIINPTPTE